MSLAIVTRTGGRPACLEGLMRTLAAQHLEESSVDVRLVISDDSADASKTVATAAGSRLPYDVVRLDRAAYFRQGPCASSMYLNALYERVPDDSWIMTLDDDAVLIHQYHLARVASVLASLRPARDVLLQDAHLGKHPTVSKQTHRLMYREKLYPNFPASSSSNNNNATPGIIIIPAVDTANMIFHKSAARFHRFTAACGGDKAAFGAFLRAGLRPVYLETRTVGIYANYFGAAVQGRNDSQCRILLGDLDRDCAAAERRRKNDNSTKSCRLSKTIFKHVPAIHTRIRKSSLSWRRRCSPGPRGHQHRSSSSSPTPAGVSTAP